MNRLAVMLAAAGSLVAVLGGGNHASAQLAAPPAGPQPPPTTPPPASPQPTPATETTSGASLGPNLPMIGTGALGLFLSYVPAVIVASRSNVSSDNDLYIPVIGPWIDIADRPGCGPGFISCRAETADQVLLVIDGIFQAWGVGAALAGIIVKDRAAATKATATVRFAPAHVGATGYGLAAFASF